MPALSNPRYERFAQELSKGKTADESYVLAGYKENRGNASTLKANQIILDRVAELQSAGSLRVEVTIASLIMEAAEIQKEARAANQHSAAIAALTAKAKLAGLWVDKNENTNRNVDPARISDAELAAVVQADSGIGTTAPSVDKKQYN